MNQTDATILARIETLEAQHAGLRRSARRWRMACLVAVSAGAIGVLAAAQRQPEVAEIVRAEALEIVDADGNALLRLGSDDYGGSLQVLNTDGTLMVGAEVSDYGGFVHVHSADGDSVGTIDITESGRATMDLWSLGNLRTRLAIDANESGAFILKNGEGQTSVLAGTSDAGPGMLITYRDDEAFAGVSTDGEGRLPVIFVTGREGSNAVEIRSTRRGEGEVWVGDRSGQGFIYTHEGP